MNKYRLDVMSTWIMSGRDCRIEYKYANCYRVHGASPRSCDGNIVKIIAHNIVSRHCIQINDVTNRSKTTYWCMVRYGNRTRN